MPTLYGEYKINENLTYTGFTGALLSDDIKFKCDGVTYKKFAVAISDPQKPDQISDIFWIKEDNSSFIPFSDYSWVDNKYRTIFIENPQEVSVEFYDWFTQNTSQDYDIVFYVNTAENNRVDKTDYITAVAYIRGVFREGSSISNVTVDIEYDTVPRFNYAYIPIFNRYYFINDITFINNKLYTISMNVDVLMTYKNGIKELEGFIDRNEFEYNPDIIDSKRVISQGFDVEEIVVKNGELKFLDKYAYSDFSYILTGYDIHLVTQKEHPEPEDTTVVNPSNGWLTASPMQRSVDITYQRSVILGEYGVGLLIKKLKEFVPDTMFTNLRERLQTLVCFPLYLAAPNLDTTDYPILVFGNEIPDSGKDAVTTRGYLWGYYNNSFDCGFCYIPKHFHNYADYNGYTKIRIFLPYYGYVDIDPNECVDEILSFRLMIDFKTGQAMYVILLWDSENNTFGRVLSNVTFQFGVEIPIGSTNESEIKRNLMLGTIKTVGNFAIGNYFGALSNTESIRNIVSSEVTDPRTLSTAYTSRNPNTNRQRTMSTRTTNVSGINKQTSTTSKQVSHSNAYKGRVASDTFNSAIGTLSSLTLNTATDKPNSCNLMSYLSTNIRVLIYRPILQDIDDEYKHLYGVPLGKTKKLKDVRGYTEISAIHLGNQFGTATENEKDEILDTLLSGIIL